LIDIWSSLKQNKLRTALTGFAVAWGLFMLIALLGAGNGLLNALLGNTDSIDRSMVISGQYTSKSYQGFDANRLIQFDSRDVDVLSDGRFGYVIDDVSPTVSAYDTLAFRDRSLQASLFGVTPALKDIQKIDIEAGRFISDKDLQANRKYAVIGSAEVKDFLGSGAESRDMLGKFVRIGPFSWKIIGVYKTDESEGGGSPQVMAPFTTVSTIYGKGTQISQIYTSFHGLDTEEESDAFEESYRRLVNQHHYAAPDDKSTVYVWNRLVTNRQLGKAERILRTAIWILGIFCLISGIVGVSNIMLITVKERTHEFGIRKALGAKPGSVLMLIIVESILITAFFGYLGMVAGLAANEIMNATLGQTPMDMGVVQMKVFDNTRVGFDVAIKATIVLIVAGTFAGLIPAWKASKVKPIEALRAE